MPKKRHKAYPNDVIVIRAKKNPWHNPYCDNLAVVHHYVTLFRHRMYVCWRGAKRKKWLYLYPQEFIVIGKL